MEGHYSISHYVCPDDLALLDFLDAIASAGFRGVGLTERAMTEIEPRRLRRELAARGLEVSSVNSAGYFLHVEPEAAAAQSAKNAWYIQAAAELGGAPLNLIVGGLVQVRGTMALAQARQRARERTAALCEQAYAAGVPVLFEPIHPMGVWAKGCVHSLRDSLDIVRRLPGVGINLDLYHSWWDSDLTAFLERQDGAVGLLQICDVTTAGPDHLPQRAPLGEGLVDIPGILASCLERPSPPPVELELFAFQLRHRAFADVLRCSVEYLSRLDRSLPGLARPGAR